MMNLYGTAHVKWVEGQRPCLQTMLSHRVVDEILLLTVAQRKNSNSFSGRNAPLLSLVEI